MYFKARSMFSIFVFRVISYPIIAHNFILDSLDLLLRDYCKIFRSTSNDILDMKLGGT